MTEIQQEEKQQELFLEFSGAAKRQERFPGLVKTPKPFLFNTTIEQIILVSIALILAGCLVFFLGVLRGKFLSERAPQYLVQNLVQRKVPVAAAAPRKIAASPVVVVKPEARPNVNQPYTIQLSTYKKQDLAEKEAVAFRHSGFNSTIISGNGYYAVCVGQYATKDAAKKDLKIFSVKYKDCFLRRRS